MINTFSGGGIISTVTGRGLQGRVRNQAQADIADNPRNRATVGTGRQAPNATVFGSTMGRNAKQTAAKIEANAGRQAKRAGRQAAPAGGRQFTGRTT